MEIWERERAVSRIRAGFIRVRLRDRWVRYVRPGRDEEYLAQEAYVDALMTALGNGLYSDEELLLDMRARDVWTESNESELNQLRKDIDEFKVQLVANAFQSERRKLARKGLKIARDRAIELETLRHAYDHMSATSMAMSARARQLVACGLYWEGGGRVFSGIEYWDDCGELLDEAVSLIHRAKLTDGVVRELARSEPWRGIWGARKYDGLFGIPACDYTDEQRALVGWSGLYDSVNEHPESPPDYIQEDDDALDGWLILRQREREQRDLEKEAEAITSNPALANADEVFIPVDSLEDARKIEKLNSPQASATKARRAAILRARGEVNETDLPDVKQKLAIEKNRVTSQVGR